MIKNVEKSLNRFSQYKELAYIKDNTFSRFILSYLLKLMKEIVNKL